MSPVTRSRSAFGSMFTLKSCGPSSPITARWIRFLSSRERISPGRSGNGSGRGESLVEVHQRFLPRPAPPAVLRPVAELVHRRERPERLRRVRARLGEDDRRALVDRAGNVAVAGDEHVGLAPDDRHDVVVRDPDPAVRPVEDEPHALAGVAHELERLQPELGVLERERVEHPDHADVRGAVDRGDHLGREPGRRVDDHVVVRGAQGRVHLAQELRGHDSGVIRTGGSDQDARARGMRREVAVELLVVERSAGLDQLVDRPFRGKAESKPDVAELQVEVDDGDLVAPFGEADREVAATSGSCPSRPSDRGRRSSARVRLPSQRSRPACGPRPCGGRRGRPPASVAASGGRPLRPRRLAARTRSGIRHRRPPPAARAAA